MTFLENNYDEYKKHMPEIQRMLNYSDILRGQIISRSSISYLKSSEIELASRIYKDHFFSVVSESFYDESYGVIIRTSNMGKLVKFSCDCYQFERTSSCKHIVACLKNFSDIIFEKKYDVNDISKSLLKKYSENNQLEIKKEVFLELEIENLLKFFIQRNT